MHHWKKIAGTVLLVGLLTSCTSLQQAVDPETALQTMLTKVQARSDIAFEGHSEIHAAGVSFTQQPVWKGTGSSAHEHGGQPAPEWNPLDKLQQLQVMKTKVKWEKTAEQGQGSVLAVNVDPVKWKESVLAQWSRQLDVIEEAQRKQAAQRSSKLGRQKADKLNAEIEGKLAEARQRLVKLNASLTADGLYRIQLDRMSGLPQLLVIETVLHYADEGGRSKEEKMIASYVLQTSGQPQTLPAR